MFYLNLKKIELQQFSYLERDRLYQRLKQNDTNLYEFGDAKSYSHPIIQKIDFVSFHLIFKAKEKRKLKLKEL